MRNVSTSGDFRKPAVLEGLWLITERNDGPERLEELPISEGKPVMVVAIGVLVGWTEYLYLGVAEFLETPPRETGARFQRFQSPSWIEMGKEKQPSFG